MNPPPTSPPTYGRHSYYKAIFCFSSRVTGRCIHTPPGSASFDQHPLLQQSAHGILEVRSVKLAGSEAVEAADVIGVLVLEEQP